MPVDDADSSNSIIRTVTNAGTDVLMTTDKFTTCGAVLQIVDLDMQIMIIVLLKQLLLPATGNV
jgi:hypothetical protein